MHHPEEEEEYDYESLGANTTMLQNAFAGALAGIAEHCAMYPVDSIKTRMQVISSSQTIMKAMPPVTLRNLWKGVNSVVLGAGPAHALHFATYEFCKDRFGANTSGHHPLASAAAGACATLAHDALMNPFDVVKQRMQLRESTYKNIRECARSVYAKEGFTAFYISLPTTLFMSIPFQSIQFSTYEFFRKLLHTDGYYDPKTHIIAGGLAGAVASSVTVPLDVIKTLLQTRGTSTDMQIRNCKGFKEAASIIKERYGWKGFFRGFKPRVLTNMPSAAISWSVYEYIKWLINVQKEENIVSL